jgi:replicative DNA helicase
MSAEIEKSLLGCILNDYKRCLPVAASIVKPVDFKEPRLAMIYETMIKMDGAGQSIDTITVSGELRLSGYTVSELSEIADCGVMAHTDTYAEQIKDLSKKRQLFLKANEVKERLLGGETFSDIVSDLMGKISELEADKISEFVNARDVINEIYKEVKEGKQHGLMTGYEKIDKITKGLQKSNLIVIGADTGKGKTAFALNIVAHALANFKTVLLYSLEMSTGENIKRLLSIISRTNSNKPDSDLMPEEVKQRLDGCGSISAFDFIVNDKQQSVSSVRATAKAKANELARNHKHIDLIVVDYVQIMTASGKADNRQGEVAGIAQELKALAKDLNVPVLILSQVNADYEKDKRDLRLNDLRESKAIAHAADLVFILNKKNADVFDPFFVMNALKNRHGPLFFMPLEFIREYTIFKEVIE